MATVIPHFKNILYRNFDPFREPLCLRFVSKGDRSIPDFSVKYVDGFCKGLICQAIAAIVDKLASKLIKLGDSIGFQSSPIWTTTTCHQTSRSSGDSRWGTGQWGPCAAFGVSAVLQSEVRAHGRSAIFLLWSATSEPQVENIKLIKSKFSAFMQWLLRPRPGNLREANTISTGLCWHFQTSCFSYAAKQQEDFASECAEHMHCWLQQISHQQKMACRYYEEENHWQLAPDSGSINLSACEPLWPPPPQRIRCQCFSYHLHRLNCLISTHWCKNKMCVQPVWFIANSINMSLRRNKTKHSETRDQGD